MKVLIIKQLFNPEPTAKSLDFAKELLKKGHDVEVLTGFPSYPLGKIYDGYKQSIYKREVIEGVNIIRVPIFPSHSSSGIKRFLNYFSYALSASFIGLFLIKKPDVCFVYQGAIPAAIPAIILKRIRKILFLYDINDLWPDTVSASGMMKNKFALKFINSWCNFNYRNANFITVATPGFYKNLSLKGIPKEKMEIVSNWCRDEITNEDLDEGTKNKYFDKSKINILYAGNLGIVQSLDTIINAANKLQENGRKELNFIFLGGGAEENRLRSLVEKKKLMNVKFISRVNSNEVSKYLKASDFLLVHLKKNDLFKITIPSKILAYLKSGKPILMGLEGDAKDILINAKAGYTFEPDNVNDLLLKLESILKLSKTDIDILGDNGKLYYENNLSIEKSVDKIETNLLNLIRN